MKIVIYNFLNVNVNIFVYIHKNYTLYEGNEITNALHLPTKNNLE